MAAREGTSLDELAERCVAALGDRPEIREIVAFGSYAGIQRPGRSGMLGVTRSLYWRPQLASTASVASERDVV